jgi:6-phosphogluconate dehydrogenase
MDVAIIGLGRMGLSLAGRAVERGHRVHGWDPDEAARGQARETAGVTPAATLEGLVGATAAPRLLLMYVPHGAPVDANLDELLPHLQPGDIVADGGNSHWEDSVRRHERCAEHGIEFLDVGTSGGTSEALGWQGAAFMVGGSSDAFARAATLLRDLAVDDGAVHHAGPAGAGHFVKLVHNAIEFGMLQSIAEGVELLQRSDYDLDLAALFEHFGHGTVIRSWLIELMANALRDEQDWPSLSTEVEDTGEVTWVLRWALERDIPTPAVTAAQTALMQSRDREAPALKALALLRHEFGGHPVHRVEGLRPSRG